MRAHDVLTAIQRHALVAIVLAYGRSLPFHLLDEEQSVAFAEALHWAVSNNHGETDNSVEAIRSAAQSLAYEPLRQRTLARLDVGYDAEAHHLQQEHEGASPLPITPDTDVASGTSGSVPLAVSAASSAQTDDRPRPTLIDQAPDDVHVPPPFLPHRDQVEATRLPVARSLQSIVSFAAPDKREQNGQLLADVVSTELPIHAEEWGTIAFIAGVYARNFPVPALSRLQLRRLWDATRWAVWYEYWFREKSLGSRINQLVSLLQRLSPPDAAQIVEQTAAELRTILTVAKSKALVDIADYLESANLSTPQARVLRAEARERRAKAVIATKHPTAGGHHATPVSPALVPARIRELLAVRLTRTEAASAIETVWGYLDPQFSEANQNRLQRGRRGEARQLADLIAHACQSAEWRLRQRRSAVGEQDIKTLCGLTLFAGGYAGDRTEAALRVVRLYGLYLLCSSALGVEGYVQLVTVVCEEVPEARERIVEHAVDEGIRQLDDPQASAEAELVQAWVAAAAAWVSVADRVGLAQLVTALERRGIEESVDLLLLRKAVATAEEATDDGLSFLSVSDRAAFDEHYRKARVYEIAELLAKHEAGILETLSRSLAAPRFSEYRPPAKTVKVGQGNQNRFFDLKRKALSGNVADAREARDAFARASAGRKEWERWTLREWRVYAAMQVDVFDAIPEWLEAFNSKTASLEEQWNLSVFHAGQREYATALTFLQSSVTAVRSSYEYLVFACYLAIQAVLHDAASIDADRARVFLIDNLRSVLAPDAQLLWIVLANKHRDDKDVMQFSDAIRAHRTLWDSPLVLPRPSLPGYPDDFVQRATKLQPLLDGLKRLKMTKTWRLWLNDVLAIQSNEHWFQVWDWAATACEDDGDINAAVNVLRRVARSNLREYNSPYGQNEDARKLFREKRTKFLRRVLIRLCELARKHDRDNLLHEIVEEFVTPVAALKEPNGQNRILHGHLQGLLPAATGGEETPTVLRGGPDAVWGQLGFVMADITGIHDLNDRLRTQIENALEIYPGGIPRGRAVAEALHQAVVTIWNLGNIGGAAEEMPALLDSLAENLEAIVRDIERFELTSLRVLSSMMMRVVRSFAEESCRPPMPDVAMHSAWVGYPSDLESSSVVIDVSFPGPGIARNLTMWIGWKGDSEPRFGTVAVAELAPGDTQCLALPARRATDGSLGSAEATVTVQYDWNFMNRVKRALVLTVPISDFAGFLAMRQIDTQEFPDPFVVDGPLTRSDVQTGLFQGRAREIEEVRRAFGGVHFPNAPMCFYGIRRTGKTSLLRRIDTELDRMGLIPIEVSLNGVVASTLSQEQVFSGFFTYVQRAVNAHYPDANFSPDVPADHPNPLMLVNGFFETLAAAFANRGRVVLLLDEFQVLIADAGEPLLDSLRPICERGLVGLIVFANQGQDIMINMPGQLALQSRRVDFLSETETADAVRVPLGLLGVTAPASTLRCVYEYTAGHPNFTMKLAKIGLATLNLEHRNVLSRNDIEDAAKEVLRSPGPFTTSWFSNKNLKPVEEDTAIKFAKIGDVGAGLAVDDQRLRQFDDAVLRNLDRKLVLQATAGRIRVRGRLLEEYLRGLIGGMAPPPPPVGITDRVGLFIDLENVVRHIAPGISFHDAGLAMQQFAAKFGEVKVRFAVAAPWNIQDWHEVKLGSKVPASASAKSPVGYRNAA